MKVLIIEDNKKLQENIRDVFMSNGYEVLTADNGKEGEKVAIEGKPDLIILDLALPDIDGQEVCRDLRNKDINCPILMLTARITISSKIEGFENGADDYLTKPFIMEELLVRLKALTRRMKPQNEELEIFIVRNIEMDFKSRTIKKSGEILPLTPIEVNLLEYLAVNAGKAMSAEEIYTNVWGDIQGDMMFSDSLKVHISRLRKKLGEGIIKTSNGYGYMISLPMADNNGKNNKNK